MTTPFRPPLSPAAQVVLDAFSNASDGEYLEGVWVVNERTMLAAALRAAADQVMPVCSTKSDRGMQRMMICNDLLIIAAELEGQP